VSYPFGHGLSYTTFAYSDLVVKTCGSHEHGDLKISLSCRVTNCGARAGKEVIQVYVGDLQASVMRPPRELKAFAKVSLDPGASTTVAFELGSRELSFWSVRAHDWLLEAGQFELAVGASSRDLRLTATVDIPAPRIAAPLGQMSTLQEWLADPAGSVALRAAFGTDEAGNPRGIIGDEELIKVIGNFPMSTLAAFPGVGLEHRMLDSLIDQIRPD
jgi:beta-glucosidase